MEEAGRIGLVGLGYRLGGQACLSRPGDVFGNTEFQGEILRPLESQPLHLSCSLKGSLVTLTMAWHQLGGG